MFHCHNSTDNDQQIFTVEMLEVLDWYAGALHQRYGALEKLTCLNTGRELFGFGSRCRPAPQQPPRSWNPCDDVYDAGCRAHGYSTFSRRGWTFGHAAVWWLTPWILRQVWFGWQVSQRRRVENSWGTGRCRWLLHLPRMPRMNNPLANVVKNL